MILDIYTSLGFTSMNCSKQTTPGIQFNDNFFIGEFLPNFNLRNMILKKKKKKHRRIIFVFSWLSLSGMYANLANCFLMDGRHIGYRRNIEGFLHWNLANLGHLKNPLYIRLETIFFTTKILAKFRWLIRKCVGCLDVANLIIFISKNGEKNP